MTDGQDRVQAEGEPTPALTTAELVRLLDELDSKICAHFKAIGRPSSDQGDHEDTEKGLLQRVFPGIPFPSESKEGGE